MVVTWSSADSCGALLAKTSTSVYWNPDCLSSVITGLMKPMISRSDVKTTIKYIGERGSVYLRNGHSYYCKSTCMICNRSNNYIWNIHFVMVVFVLGCNGIIMINIYKVYDTMCKVLDREYKSIQQCESVLQESYSSYS